MWRQRRYSSLCHQEPRPKEKLAPADKQSHRFPSNNKEKNKTRTFDIHSRASDFGLRCVIRKVADRQRLCDGDDGGNIAYKEVPVAFVSILDDREEEQ